MSLKKNVKDKKINIYLPQTALVFVHEPCVFR